MAILALMEARDDGPDWKGTGLSREDAKKNGDWILEGLGSGDPRRCSRTKICFAVCVFAKFRNREA